MSELKKVVKQFADIATSLPENLQVVCFELLLKSHLGGVAVPPAASVQVDPTLETPLADPPSDPPPQDDLSETDLHAKTRRFMQQHGLSMDHLNNLFYKDGDEIRTLYEDLATTVMADGQIRIALLQALGKALSTGAFDADVEAIRAEATDRKFYDGPNFTKNFKNSKDLFDFDEWSKDVRTIRLSLAGRKRLAEVIKELQ